MAPPPALGDPRPQPLDVETKPVHQLHGWPHRFRGGVFAFDDHYAFRHVLILPQRTQQIAEVHGPSLWSGARTVLPLQALYRRAVEVLESEEEPPGGDGLTGGPPDGCR